MLWRWDQGRMDYFQLDEVKRISGALTEFDGAKLPYGDESDTLRAILTAHSGRPFLPSNYKVWRNYKRVFGCQMLAADIAGKVVCTELAKAYSAGSIDGDQYLLHFVRNFYHSSPVFDDYSPQGPKTYTCLSVLKLLISEYVLKGKSSLSLEVIVGTLKSVSFTGAEDLDAYAKLQRKSVASLASLNGDEGRQIRELVVFISQLSFLKWSAPFLYLDVASKDEALKLFGYLTPQERGARFVDPGKELLRLGELTGVLDYAVSVGGGVAPEDVEFTEGGKIRVTHLRYERSAKLKELFLSTPGLQHNTCDLCGCDLSKLYSWVSGLIELHHLLPLSSAVKVNKNATSIDDLVPLCPTCHRAVHKFYSSWLKGSGKADFSSSAEALAVYNSAKSKFNSK